MFGVRMLPFRHRIMLMRGSRQKPGTERSMGRPGGKTVSTPARELLGCQQVGSKRMQISVGGKIIDIDVNLILSESDVAEGFQAQTDEGAQMADDQQSSPEMAFSLAVKPSLTSLLAVDEVKLRAGQLTVLSSDEADAFLDDRIEKLTTATKSLDEIIAKRSQRPQ
jgi:hypothetical protein